MKNLLGTLYRSIPWPLLVIAALLLGNQFANRRLPELVEQIYELRLDLAAAKAEAAKACK